VQNFVTLAEGVREWRDPATGLPVKRPFYDGLTFHRVIPDFMIQAGDPTGTGRYTPGYTLPDEIDPSLHFDKPGVVAMANAGQDTNGSQFFIVEKAPLAQLPDGKYPIFGQVIEGMDAVHAIAQGERDKDDHPLHPVVIRHVRIGHGAPTGSTGNP
jgi:peptidyl-prolyl cis-trans isomerase A (cyclophilin A)